MNGPEVIARLQQTAEELTREKQRLESVAAEYEGRMSELVRQRGTALLELARHYLPDLTRSTIEATFVGIRQELLDVLAKHDAQQRDRAAAAEAANNRLTQLQAQLAVVTDKLNGLVKQREALEPLVATQLTHDPKFTELAKLAEQARVTLKRNQARVAELEQAAKEKLPAYERSTLFQYLHRRRFATSEYSLTVWTRDLDRWVARLINYSQARRGYEFLRRSPEVLNKELENRQQEFNALLAQMQAIEGEAAKAAGLTAVREQGTQCGRQRDSLVAESNRHQDELHAIQSELQQLGSEQNKFYQEALTRLQRFLGDAKASVLEACARQTPEPQDDHIVASIAALTTELEQSKPRINELNQNRGVATERLQGIEQLISRYRGQNFDSIRSYFEPPFQFDALLSRFTAGESTSDELWRTMRAQQRFRPTVTHQVGGSVTDAMNNSVLLDTVVQVAAMAIEAAARSSHASPRQHSSPGGFSGNAGSSHHDSSGGSTWSGGDSSSGGTSPSTSDTSFGGGDSGGSFTSGDGF